jgi:group I intron endonuclease
MPCIYIFTSPKGKSYIGQTVNFEARKKRHLLDSQNRSNYPFHRAIKMYGIENFQEEVIICEEHELNLLERFFIGIFKGIGKVYNLTDGGGGIRGLIRTPEHCRKLSESQKGKIVSEETKLKQKEAALNRNPLTRIGVGLGRKFSEQTKLKMRNSRLGHKMSEETRAKMRYIMSNRSEEYRANISKAKLGDKNPMFGRRKNALTTTGGTGTEAS